MKELNENLMSLINCVYGTVPVSYIAEPEKDAIFNNIREEYAKQNPKDEDVYCFDLSDRSLNFSHIRQVKMKNLCNKSFFCVKNRNEVENLSRLIQVVVGCIIYDENNILLLEKIKHDKCKNEGALCMVTGHCTIPENYSEDMTFQQMIDYNIKKELQEEIKYSNENKKIISDNFHTLQMLESEPLHQLVYPLSYKHMGFIYSMKVDSIYEIISNEPEKFKTKVIPISYLEYSIDKLDDWVRASIGKVKPISE